MKSRRNVELRLGLLAVGITGLGYVLVQLPEKSDIPADLWFFVTIFVGLYVLAHMAVLQFAPNADPSLLPLAAMLNGIGFVTISRLDPDLARTQVGWMAAGMAAFFGTLVVVRRIRTLERYRYTFLLLGLLALLLPLAPGIGKTINGARLWVGIGPINFQPGEAAKVLLVIFFAAYLVDKRELLSSGSRRLGRLVLPSVKHLGPLLLAWAVSILVMVMQKDLGSSLLFFAVFGAMLYAATERAAYLITALVLFVGGATIAHRLFDHVQDRVTTWLDPWPVAADEGFQVVQSWFAFGTGGFSGTGLGRGNPQLIPNAPTDFVFSAIGEELGLIGAVAVIAAILMFVGSGFRIALEAERPFPKLFAAGLTVIMGVQTFVIIGGVTRVIPLTGVTLPFISYGGSSLVANFVVLGLLLRISDDNARARGLVRRRTSAPTGATPS
ncbi:MAG: FtsW/RodA/SpoVE family cell cycle protein [Actinobacteria bacterium]|nr:FtsW/RodA/SpoVE family cell cycle protein [Actinomycetota bacterium]